MKQSTFNEIWDEAYCDRETILAEYYDLEYLPRLLTTEEITMVRDTVVAAELAETFDDFCRALGISTADVAEELGIPADVIAKWRGRCPTYLKRMIACLMISAEIEDGRCHTCQSCGEFFFTTDDDELLCEDCKREQAWWF